MPSESTKLRWYAPLWKDPVSWARWGGRSRKHLAFAIVAHFALWGLWMFCLFAFATIRTIGDGVLINRLPLFFLLGLAFVASVFIPAAYLYALYRLIRIIDENSGKA